MAASSREFARLYSGAPDSRVPASLTLFCVLVCATLALTQRPPLNAAPSAPAANRLAEASPPRVVKRVDAVPADTPCEQRAWPNFDAKCPGPAGPRVATTVAPAPPAAVAAAPAPSAQPAGAALASAPFPAPSTTGTAARFDDPPATVPPARAPDAASYTRNWATWDERADEPVKQPPRRAVKRQPFGIFGFRF